MELNKCSRCGAFFASSKNICPNCEPKDFCEISKLENFLAENDCPATLDSLACSTGISIKNLNRFLAEDNFSHVSNNFSGLKKGIGNVSVEV